MIIREAKTEDYKTIVDFQLKMAKETENLDLVRETVTKGVQAVFEDPCKGVYYVTEYRGDVVASLLTTFEWSDWRNSTVLWIQSVYVVKEFRKQKIFRKMYGYLKEKVNTSPEYSGLRLYVDKTNTIAQKAYTNIGMDGDHYQLYEWMEE